MAIAENEPTQHDTPYLDAIRDYAARNPARLHIPGHKGGPGADPGLVAVIGAAAVAHDIPGLTWGIDIGPSPTPFDQAQRLAAEAWGAARAWFLVSGASQGNLATGLALAHYGDAVVLQRNGHSSTIDALVLSGLRPTFVAPEIDEELGIAHCITPRVARPRAARDAGRGRRVDRLADLLRLGRRRPRTRGGRARARRAAGRR